jgi:dTMP kinase
MIHANRRSTCDCYRRGDWRDRRVMETCRSRREDGGRPSGTVGLLHVPFDTLLHLRDCADVSATAKRGVLIALEGIDGAGKTTQAERLEAALRSGGCDVLRTKEPTDGQWGRKLRESGITGRLSPEEELDLFLKDRREHVLTRIQPALEAGKIVIVDRYYFSTVAYQGARGLDPTELLARNEEFAPRPDLLVILDVEPRLGLQRISGRGDKANAFEQEADLHLVARAFRAMDFPYLVRVDGALRPENITAGLLDVLYDGPLASAPRQIESVNGRVVTNNDLWTELLRPSASNLVGNTPRK